MEASFELRDQLLRPGKDEVVERAPLEKPQHGRLELFSEKRTQLPQNGLRIRE